MERQEPDYAENFSFYYNNILFIGIDLVSGNIHDAQEWDLRQQADLKWINDNYRSNRKNAQAMVVFAHSAPGLDLNSAFFDPFFAAIEKKYAKNLRTILVHRNLVSQTWGIERDYRGITNLDVVTVEGGAWPPLQMSIDLRNGVDIQVEQEQWYGSVGGK